MKKIIVLVLSLVVSIYSFSVTNLKNEELKSEIDGSELCSVATFVFDSKQEKENRIARDKKYFMEKNNFSSEKIPEGVIMSADYPTPLGYTISYVGFYKNNKVSVYGNSDKTEEIKKVFYKEMEAIGYKPKDSKKNELTEKEANALKKGETTNKEGFGTPQDASKKPPRSPWDGVAFAIKSYMKENANNPKTIEYIDAYKLEELSNGYYAQKVKFRSENSYGGMVIYELIFIMSGDGKESVVTGVGTQEEYKKLRKDNDIVTVTFHD